MSSLTTLLQCQQGTLLLQQQQQQQQQKRGGGNKENKTQNHMQNHDVVSFSLRQLVPIHLSLLQCFSSSQQGQAQQRNINDDVDVDLNDGTNTKNSLDKIIRIRCGQNEIDYDICNSILKGTASGDEASSSLTFLKNNSIDGNDNDDAKKLLILQYLMYPLTFVDAMRYVLIPFLLLPSSSNNNKDDKDNSLTNEISEDLVIALLDVMDTFEQTNQGNGNNEDAIAFSQEQSDDETSSSALETTWNTILIALGRSKTSMASRILHRLVTKIPNNNNNLSTSSSSSPSPSSMIFIDAYYMKLWQIIQDLASSSSSSIQEELFVVNNSSSHPLLSTLATDLLPLLTQSMDVVNSGETFPEQQQQQQQQQQKQTKKQKKNKQKQNKPKQQQQQQQQQQQPMMWSTEHRVYTQKLWMQLFSLYTSMKGSTTDTETEKEQERERRQRRQVLLVITTVLCIVLPHLVDYKLPMISYNDANEKDSNKDQDESTFLHPIDQPVLWDIIYECLGQGKSLLESNTTTATGISSTEAVSSTLRKRALYLLDTLNTPSTSTLQSPSSLSNTMKQSNAVIWKKFVMCVETLEMEHEQHLIEQIWDTVAELMESMRIEEKKIEFITKKMDAPGTNSAKDISFSIHTRFTWKWMSVLFSRVLSSPQPVIRKLGLYRLLKAQDSGWISSNKNKNKKNNNRNDNNGKNKAKAASSKKKNKRQKARNVVQQQQPNDKNDDGATGGIVAAADKNDDADLLLQQLENIVDDGNYTMLDYLSSEFIIQVLLPSWDSLHTSVGYIMHLDNANASTTTTTSKIEKEDMVTLFQTMLQKYIQKQHQQKDKDVEMFWKLLWDWKNTLQHFHAKTIVLVFQSLTSTGSTDNTNSQNTVRNIPVTDETLQSLIVSYKSLFQVGSVIVSYKKELLLSLCIMLSRCGQPKITENDNDDDKKIKKLSTWKPMTILQLLALISAEHLSLADNDNEQTTNEGREQENWNIMNDKMLSYLKDWISGLENHVNPTMLGATLATAYVDGQLLPNREVWDIRSGATKFEREIGWSIVLLCTLAAASSSSSGTSSSSADGPRRPTATTTTTTAELLWPAISKGLSNVAGAILSKDHARADHVSRSLLLLENGCVLRQLSGLGNGDLVVDKKTQQLLPPPPNIEGMLSTSVEFILFHIKSLVSIEYHIDTGGGTRSGGAKLVSMMYSRLVTQIRTLHQSFPSSGVIESAVNDMLQSSIKTLSEGPENDSQVIMVISSIYAVLSSGAMPDRDSYISVCRLLLGTNLKGDLRKVSKAWEQTARSILQYTKWAAISCILPLLIDYLDNDDDKEVISDSIKNDANKLLEDLLESALDTVEATPADALLPLFNCILEAGKQWTRMTNPKTGQNGDEQLSADSLYAEKMENMIAGLLTIMEDSSISSESTYMLNEICSLVFRSKLLWNEYQRLEENPDCSTPIRNAFRKLIAMAGSKKPHITRCVLCRITVGWLGEAAAIGPGEAETDSKLGLSAIPYKDDVIKLLMHKEMKLEEGAANQSQVKNLQGVAEIPTVTNDMSVARAFLLVFLSKIPNVGNGLNDKLLKEFLHPVILGLLHEAEPENPTQPTALIMRGTPVYCLKMRAWQALCNLTRFITEDIAEQVCDIVFRSMPEQIHSQIRYFVEVFTIRCGTLHPQIFGPAFVKDISRRDLSLQHVSSLMIMGGNWIVGRYKLDIFTTGTENKKLLKEVVAAVIPWLSSTQGFSRAIAQLLVHALVPLVADTSNLQSIDLDDADWYILTTYRFLDENREMKRLRNKQSKFFETYDVEEMCTPVGVLGIPVDEGDEADPIHLVDAIKETLKEVYEEAHVSDTPDWKQVEGLLQAEEEAAAAAAAGNDEDEDDDDDKEEEAVNFQRKIIPLDSLNLAMENIREKKLKNLAGQRKQQLIICASLIDKVPNLGGLARTSEIFAADKLIVPDASICKMDNFKSLSVGAGDWIDIEEVREENLNAWLLDHKQKGYFVFGLEQTSSSVSLAEMAFPDRPTVLLLGKEKEGIPVEFLQAVDQCVEIPQLGIIRSLNVHVSGAIAIWEHTKQRRFPKL